jgi:hypothetical protein
MKCMIFFLVFLAFLRLEANSITDILDTIPKESQEDLKYLFHIVFLEQDGAYTIFGNKPVSMAGKFLIDSWETTIKGEVGKFGKAWKTWQNYKNKFIINNYLIIGERHTFKKSDSVVLNVSVINKKAFIKTVNHNLFLFETLLDQKIDPKKILDDIEKGKLLLWQSIKHNEILLGILLGYGNHNAYLFNEKSFFRTHYLFSRKISKLKCSDEEIYPLMIVNPVQYSADLDHPETKMLQKMYKNLRKKISAIYSQGDFLEITLSQLISN